MMPLRNKQLPDSLMNEMYSSMPHSMIQCEYAQPMRDNDNDNDNENMFITIDLHIYRIQDARYQYTENKHLTLFFLW